MRKSILVLNLAQTPIYCLGGWSKQKQQQQQQQQQQKPNMYAQSLM